MLFRSKKRKRDAVELDAKIVFALVRAFFGIRPDPPLLSDLSGPVNWERAAEVADAHGVGPLCHEGLACLGATGVGMSAALALMWERRRAGAQRYLRLSYDLREILGVMDARGIRPVLLKGASLAFAVYPNPTLRPMGDLDLLVRKEDAPKAQEALASLGYSPQFVAATRWEEENLLAHLPFQSAPGRIPVEIHFRLFPKAMPYFPDEENLWGRVVPTTVEGRQAFRLAPADELLYLCGHLRKHAQSLYQLIWFCDVALLWKAMKPEDRAMFFDLLSHNHRREEIEAVLRTARAWFLEQGVEAAHDLEAVMDSPLTVSVRDRTEAWLRMEELLGYMPGWGPRVRFVAGYLFPRLSYIRQFHRVETAWSVWGWRLLRPFWVIGRAVGALRARRAQLKSQRS